MAGIIKIDQERCKGCDYCIVACPHKLIEKADFLNAKGVYPVKYKGEDEDKTLCPGKGCVLCALACPEVAIEVLKEDEGKKPPEGGKK